MQREDQGKFLKNRTKSRPRLKRLKALWRKWHYRLISMQKATPKRPERPSYGNSRKVSQNPLFLKKCKGGTKGNFSKIAQKDALAEKAQKHCGANGIIL